MEKRAVEITNPQQKDGATLVVRAGNETHNIAPQDKFTVGVEDGYDISLRFDQNAKGNTNTAPQPVPSEPVRNYEPNNQQRNDQNDNKTLQAKR